MLKQMRRKDKALSEDQAVKVFSDCVYATLSTLNEDGTPYCVPVSPAVFTAADGTTVIYVHGFHKGQKVDNLKADGRVCISAVSRAEVIQEEYSTSFESAVAEGKAAVITDEAEYREALRLICEKYSPDYMDLFEKNIANSFNHTAVIKITVAAVTGKSSFKPKK